MGTVALGRLRLVAALRAGDPVTGAELRGTLRDGLEALAAYERGVAAAQGPAALAAYDRARGPRRDA